MNLSLDSLMGASGLQSSLKWENSKQGFVRKSDRSIYNRTRVTQGVTWTCWSLMVNAEEMKTALVTQSVCQPFIKTTQVILKQVRCTMLTKSGQVYCLKAILLPINCRKMELFPRGIATDQTAPRRPFPVQSQGISSHSLVALARTLEYFLPLKLWPSRLLLENKSCQSRFDFTYCSSGFVFAFGDFSFLWQLFIFQKISKAATLFRYFTFQWGHVITHSSRQEWYQRSHRLDHIIWQIWDVILIFIWSNQGALFSATFPCQISFIIVN